MQVAWQMDSSFPKDAMVITPHFSASAPFTDHQSLCDDLADAINAWDTVITRVTVKAYDAQAVPPSFPLAEAVRNQPTIQASSLNRDVALCLSYYSGNNRPRNRGRLYIPCAVCGISPNGARPTLANREKVAALVPIFTALGGIDIDWCVFSRRDNQPKSVSNWWVDDSWDTQRRRGLAPSARLEGAVSE